MIKNYKKDLKEVNRQIKDLKLAVENGDENVTTLYRLELLKEERCDLEYSISMMEEYVQAVENRRKGVA